MNQPSYIDNPFETTASGDARDEQPRGAIIELVERHKGRKRSYTGAESVIVPNHLRINGVAIFASTDTPAVLCQTIVDGMAQRAFAVTVQVMARALKVGGTASFDPDAEGLGPDVSSAAVIEIPDVESWTQGDVLERRWVLLNGHRVWTTGEVMVGRAATHGEDQYAAMVTMTLLCRQLVVDDQPTEPAAAEPTE